MAMIRAFRAAALDAILCQFKRQRKV